MARHEPLVPADRNELGLTSRRTGPILRKRKSAWDKSQALFYRGPVKRPFFAFSGVQTRHYFVAASK